MGAKSGSPQRVCAGTIAATAVSVGLFCAGAGAEAVLICSACPCWPVGAAASTDLDARGALSGSSAGADCSLLFCPLFAAAGVFVAMPVPASDTESGAGTGAGNFVRRQLRSATSFVARENAGG